jgi:hypothetical protein
VTIVVPGPDTVEIEVRSKGEFDDAIHVRGPRLQLLERAGLPVVHDQISTGGRRDGRLLRSTHGGGNGRARPPPDLDREASHCAGAAGHQHVVPVDRPITQQAVGGGDGGNAEGGTELEGGAIGQESSPIRRNHCVLGGRPPAVVGRGKQEPDALAHPIHRHSRTDGLDHACAVHVRHLVSVEQARRGPATSLDVGGIDG